MRVSPLDLFELLAQQLDSVLVNFELVAAARDDQLGRALQNFQLVDKVCGLLIDGIVGNLTQGVVQANVLESSKELFFLLRILGLLNQQINQLHRLIAE